MTPDGGGEACSGRYDARGRMRPSQDRPGRIPPPRSAEYWAAATARRRREASGSSFEPRVAQGRENPVYQRALFKYDIGFERHVGLQRYLLTLRDDVRTVELHRRRVGGLLEGDRSLDIGRQQDCLRHPGDPAMIGSETLIGERVEQHPDILSDLDESDRADRNE